MKADRVLEDVWRTLGRPDKAILGLYSKSANEVIWLDYTDENLTRQQHAVGRKQ